MPRINVPLYRQPHVDYCVPACIKMILDHYRNKYGEKEIKNLSLSKIAKKMKTQTNGVGTTDTTVELINELLIFPKYYIHFNIKYPCSWNDVITENNKGKPIIAWIWLSSDENLDLGCGHSVVITDISQNNSQVIFNDPLRGEISENVVSFISRWENDNVNKTLIFVKVEKREQTKLAEFNRRKLNE